MNTFKDIIDNFIYQKIDIPTYINYIKAYNFTNEEFNSFLKNFNENNLVDKRMNALLIIWFFKHKDFNFNYQTIYLKYINEMISEMSNVNPQFLTIGNNYLITIVDNFYFIINHDNKDNIIYLPKELQNNCVYCYNCNDDLTLSDNIILPEFSFYVLRIN